MTRAEKAAIEVYPRIIWYRMDKKPIDKNQTKRIGFIQGYEQAEKDLGWISVKERLPGPSECVVACVEVEYVLA